MEAPAVAEPRVRINRWLPYWAVFQADLRQTVRSWVYRVWVLVSSLVAVGYLLYRLGLTREAGIFQPASNFMTDLLRWTVFGSVTLIVVLAGGSISSERGTLADSVLSRGISRYQYFLGKWHARLLAVLGAFVVMGVLAMGGSFLLLHEDLSLSGSLWALLTVAALLMAVITLGVAVSAVSNSTLVGIAVLWMMLYGVGFGLSLLPAYVPSPDRALENLPQILRGYYNWRVLARMIGWSGGTTLLAALFGLVYFGRRDV